ncbi:DUF4214 domain-containing protein [Massilia sp. HP4]|uniref:DUF4214 domain-containing protein n=1 Tax=Massilia sp. HP4 TaxID=2562316 RepID=UPI0010C0C17A|nr:DUF4214 domain-containing protein [Massilia sp. HP4]
MSTFESTVHSFYLAFFGRPADPDGLAFWSGQLAANGGDTSLITRAFADSEEAKVRFGDDTPEQRIAQIYQQLFNRAPEATGLAFWSDAVKNGHVSLADVAVTILEGAQGSDLDLAALREQAVADFTARVELSDSDYAGYAAVEAARVLVRAVTPGATQDDLARLVESAVDFADIASNNPKVIDAIATGSTLLALFDTKRGLEDPVTLVQALADVAEAAAGNPDTLASLLRGGGMAQVLKVMPARATLQDVVDALEKGGLPAAIDVVYPPRPTPVPPQGVSFSFVSVEHGPDDRKPGDHVTNMSEVDIVFRANGSLQPGQKIQYRHNGSSEWTDVTPVNGLIRLKDVALTDGEPVGEYRAGAREPMPDHLLTVELRVANANGATVGTPFQQEILLDVTDPHGQLGFVRIGQGPEGDLTTGDELVDVTFTIDDTSDGVVQWRIKGSDAWTDAPRPNGSGLFTLRNINLSEEDQTIELRVIDAAGNVGDHGEWTIDGPVGPAIQLRFTDDGLGITSPVTGSVEIGGMPAETTHASHGVVAGQEAILGEQGSVRSGTLAIAPQSGANVNDPSGISFVLGTGGNDVDLSGTHVWGFGGNDELSGTEGDDYLFGGDGDDIIWSNGGEDKIAGGAGADDIRLSTDGKGSLIGYEAGDTRTGLFDSGNYVTRMDQIHGAEAGDSFFIGEGIRFNTPSIGNQFLTSTADGQVALVRGNATIDSRFFSSLNGSSWMLQWTEDNAIHSILLRDYADGVPELEYDPLARTIKLVDAPMQSTFTDAIFQLSANNAIIRLQGDPENLAPATSSTNGMLSTAGLVLEDLVSRENVATDYVDRVHFGGVQNDGGLHLGRELVAGVYEMSWNDATFATQSGTLAADSVKFAGGAEGLVVQHGFTFDQEAILNGNPVSNAGGGQSILYRSGSHQTELTTGFGHDVVAAAGGPVRLKVESAASAAQDLVIGFGTDDRVVLGTDFALALEHDSQGDLVWAPYSTGMLTPDAAIGAVYIETFGILGSNDLDQLGSPTLGTLGTRIDASEMAAGGKLLILAKDMNGTGGALYYYSEVDGNGLIDAGEVSVIALFTDGMPEMQQIELVGLPDWS